MATDPLAKMGAVWLAVAFVGAAGVGGYAAATGDVVASVCGWLVAAVIAWVAALLVRDR